MKNRLFSFFWSFFFILAKNLIFLPSLFKKALKKRIITINNIINQLKIFTMKKLALALVCLFSVAFFASCDPEEEPIIENPEPTIALMTGDNFLYNGQVIELNTEYVFGVRVESNAETNVALSKLVVTYESDLLDPVERIIDLTGMTEYEYIDTLYYVADKGIIGDITYSAVVTDADGKTNSASIKVDVNMEDELEVTPFEWKRENGHDGTGLEEFGLQWTTNVHGKFLAVIEPITGEKVTMYSVPAEKWDEVVTETDKAALFSDGGVAEVIQDYRGISVDSTQEYDVVIATLYKEEYHLIHITKCTVEQRYYVFTITGEAK